ncbi:hypothetical protein NQ317_016274 [Molorchus minor]|uniref:Uncharacterized protein n=1 Tax=Molorchus minor TaxID=1323400 RepID=A0ABQ9JZ68_9CUCU|nr:hypothetical protein NQ317_016274 [Molorchus minor]
MVFFKCSNEKNFNKLRCSNADINLYKGSSIVYEDWPHHLLLKTCYRTSANLSDGSICSQPAYRFMFIHGCIHANSTLIELVFRNICLIGSRNIFNMQ